MLLGHQPTNKVGGFFLGFFYHFDLFFIAELLFIFMALCMLSLLQVSNKMEEKKLPKP